MISHYVVDAVLIIGYVMGALGVLCLAYDQFGKLGLSGPGVVRRVLMVAIPGGIYFGYLLVRVVGTFSPLGTLPLWLWIILLVFNVATILNYILAMVYTYSRFQQLHVAESTDSPLPLSGWLIRIIGKQTIQAIGYMVGWYLLIIVVTFGKSLRYPAGQFSAWIIPIIVVAMGPSVFFAVAWLATRLNERRLVVLGLTATFAGILIQFLPQVLDLLNIKVG